MLAGGITAALCLTLLLIPGLIHWLFQIASDPATIVMSRRAAMLFLGLSIIVWRSRNETASPLRQTVCFGVSAAMGGLLCLGLIEFINGTVGIGIALAVVTELFFAAAFWKHATAQ
jgi:hypothetical protein